MLEDDTFVRLLQMAFPAPLPDPNDTSFPGDVTHLGPGRVSLAYSMVRVPVSW
jgi:hypothetical protein